MNLDRQRRQLVNFSDAATKAAFVNMFKLLDGMYYVKIQKFRRRRSNEQNRYYWGVVLPTVCGGIAEAWGEQITADEAHLVMKQMFLARPIINRTTGEELAKVWPSSATLTTDQFSEYIEKIGKFAAESLGCVVPPASAF